MSSRPSEEVSVVENPILKINTWKYIVNFLKIRTKSEGLKPFVPNKPQTRLYECIREQSIKKKPVRVIILKARQMGFSTMTSGTIFTRTATQKYIQSAIITHSDATTQELFAMYKRYYDNLPDSMKPCLRASNAKELIFNTQDGKGLDSKIKCMTATDESVGRGGTTQYVHMSEFAFWKNPLDVYTSIMQCVPNSPNTMVIIESTACGYNFFKEMWDQAVAGDNDYVPLFFAWFEMDEYRMPYTGFELTSYEKWLQEEFNVDLDQLTWRRWCIKNNCANDEDKFKQEYPATPEEAFLFSGNSYFSMENLKKAKERNIKPLCYGHFEYDRKDRLEPKDIKFVESDEKDIIRIYKKPSKYTPYVIGGDTAGEGSDEFIGQVVNNLTGEQEALLEFNGSDEIFYAEQMYCLGMYYNWGLMAIETNFSTYPQKKLEEWDYPSFYIREKYDEYTNRLKNAYGFRTDVLSRPVILAGLQTLIKEHYEVVVDLKTLQQCETFVKNEKGKPEAMEGEHDDHVMALAIAYHSRNQQQFEPYKEERTKVDRTKTSYDLVEDDDYYDDEEGDDFYIWN